MIYVDLDSTPKINNPKPRIPPSTAVGLLQELGWMTVAED